MAEMLNNAREYRERRAKVVADARALLPTDGSIMTPEAAAKFDAMMLEADQLKDHAERIERAVDADADASKALEIRAGRHNITVGEAHRDSSRELSALMSWCRGVANQDDHAILNQCNARNPDFGNIRNALSHDVSTGGAAGAYTIPEAFRTLLEVAMASYGGVRKLRTTVMKTSAGNPIPMPTVNDTGNEGVELDENTTIGASVDPTFGQIVMGAYTYSSKPVMVPFQLMQDSAFDLAPYIAGMLARRIGKITARRFTTGNGTTQPNGFVTAATVGKTGAAGQTTTFTYTDLVELMHSVDADYRENAEWAFPDPVLMALKTLQRDDGIPAWVPGIALREPDTILGKSYQVCVEMATPAASAKSIAFGDFSKFLIRDVTGAVMLRLVERYADLGQIAFILWSRHDSDLLDAGTHPIKVYQHPAA